MEVKNYEKLSGYVLYRCIDEHVGGAVALYGAVVVWLGFVYSICYTGSFHQLNLCFSFLLSGLSLLLLLWGKKVFAKNQCGKGIREATKPIRI